MSKYAICYLGYKLKPFEEECIASIAKNDPNHQYDAYAFIDNCGDENESNKVKNLFLKYFPNANIIMRDVPYGEMLNIAISLHEMFSKNYDGIFYCENDIYFDDNVFATLINLEKWAKVNVPNAVVFSSWNYNLKYNEYPNQYNFYWINHGLDKLNYSESCTYAENEVGFTGQNHWGALITKRAWDAVSPYVLRHFSAFINAKEISMKAFDFKNFIYLISKLSLVNNISNEFKYRTLSRFEISGYEPIYETALIANGLLRLALTNPRSKSFEDPRNEFKRKLYEMCGLDKINTLHSKNVPTEFILNQKSKELFTK